MPDFALGGMENWGLITFRREYLVYHENFISVFTKAKMMKVISHDLAHMVGFIITVYRLDQQ